MYFCATFILNVDFNFVCQRLKITKIGDVAQLARALGWQPRGRRFEPDLLHF